MKKKNYYLPITQVMNVAFIGALMSVSVEPDAHLKPGWTGERKKLF